MLEKSTGTARMTAEQIGLQTLWALLQGSPLAIFAVDQDGSVRIWNRAGGRLFGWQEQEVLGRAKPIVPEGREEEFRRLRDRALAREMYTDMDVRVRRGVARMERKRNPGSVGVEGLSPGLRCAASRLREWNGKGVGVVLGLRSLTLGNGR